MEDRRSLKSRNTFWANSIALALAKTKITPNQISMLSILMALISMLAFYFSATHEYLLIVAAIFIQLRLLCNLFDGMVAVEYNKKSHLGDLYNDLPDRFADLFIILGLSLAVRDLPYALFMGWLAVFCAMTTAYIRVLGRSLGSKAYFIGPMAKQHRMFVCTASALIQYLFFQLNSHVPIIYYALFIIIVGSIVTCSNRLIKISNEIK